MSGSAPQLSDDERAPGAARLQVDAARHQLLAGAALALDQHRAVAAGDATDHREHLVDLRTASDDRGQTVAARDDLGERHVLAPQRSRLGGLGHRLAKLGVAARLGDEVAGAQAHRLHRGLHVGVAGQHDQLGVERDGAGPAQDVEAGVIGHLDVEQRDVEVFASEAGHALGGGGGLGHVGAGLHEDRRQDAPDLRVVVDDEDANTVRHVAPCYHFQ